MADNAIIKDVDGHLNKDESSERESFGVLSVEAAHFSDAADKYVWTKNSRGLKAKGEN